MAPVMEMRKRFQDKFEKEHGVKIGFMSFFVKAAVAALKKYPVHQRQSIDGNDIVYHGYFDIGIAVGSPRGLVVPILRNADQMSFADIEKKIAEFGTKARDGKLSIDELTRAAPSRSATAASSARCCQHADHQPAAERHPRRARDQGPRRGRERPDRGAADELPGDELRPPHHRRPRGRARAGGDEGSAGRPGAAAVRHLTALRLTRRPPWDSPTNSSRLDELQAAARSPTTSSSAPRRGCSTARRRRPTSRPWPPSTAGAAAAATAGSAASAAAWPCITGVESWIWRLILFALALFGGTGVLLYILLWIFVPHE